MITDVRRVLELLRDAGIDFVVIGGQAAVLLGTAVITEDVDVCYARGGGNEQRLAEALRSIGAKLRNVDPDLPFLLDGQTIAMGDSFMFDTDLGKVDVLATPSGTRGYPELASDATTFDLGGGLEVRVVSIDHLIMMKRAAGRPKDLIAVEHLLALRDELRGED